MFVVSPTLNTNGIYIHIYTHIEDMREPHLYRSNGFPLINVEEFILFSKIINLILFHIFCCLMQNFKCVSHCLIHFKTWNCIIIVRDLLFLLYGFPRASFFFFQKYSWFGFCFPNLIVRILQIYLDFKIRNDLLPELFQF